LKYPIQHPIIAVRKENRIRKNRKTRRIETREMRGTGTGKKNVWRSILRADCSLTDMANSP
jgi:hypothetical protein